MIDLLPIQNEILKPVTLNDLESEKNSTPTSFAPGIDRNEKPSLPSKIISEYALSLIMKKPYYLAYSIILTYIDLGAAAPTGLDGYDKTIYFVLLSMSSGISSITGRKSFSLTSG